MKHFPVLLQLTASLLLLSLSHPAFAVDPAAPAQSSRATVTLEMIQRNLAEVEAATNLDDAAKNKLIGLYRKAISFQEAARESISKQEAYSQARQTAAGEAEEVRRKLEEIKKTSPIEGLGVSDTTSIDKLSQLLVKEKADYAAVDAKLAELKQQLNNEVDHPVAARQRLTEAKQRQEIIAAELKAPVPEGDAPDLAQARHWVLESESAALNAEIYMLDQELISQPMRVGLLEAQRDRYKNSLEWIRQRTKLLENLLSGRRLAEAVKAMTEAEEAQREAAGKHPLLEELAARNAVLSEGVSAVAADLERLANADAALDKKTTAITDEYRSTEKKLELAGLSVVLGRVLLEQRRNLPDVRQFRKLARQREQEISMIGLQLIQYHDEREQLGDTEDYVNQLTAALPPEERDRIESELQGLAAKRLQLIEQALSLDQAYIRALGEVDFAQQRLLETVEKYQDFLNEHLLWIRSAPFPDLKTLQALPKQIELLLSPANWLEVAIALYSRARQSPLPLLVLSLVGVLLLKARRIREHLVDTGTRTRKTSQDSYVLTLKAVVLTFLLAIPWPLLVYAAGWELSQALDYSQFTRAVAVACFWIAETLFYLLFFRALCVPGGLGAAHFRWPGASVKSLRHSIDLLMLILLPAALVAILLITADSSTFGAGLVRISIALVLFSLGGFLYRLLGSKRGVLSAYLTRHPEGLLTRLRHVWLGLGVGVPAVLALLALGGYVYTAATLTGNMIDTMWFILILFVVHQLVVRWLLLTQRRFALQTALERRAVAMAVDDESRQPVDEGVAQTIEEPEIDLTALGEDTRKLLSTALAIAGIIGVWLIWSDVLPAFRVLHEITLWSQVTEVGGEEKRIPITLASVMLAVLLGFATAVAAKRFPALLEILLLQRLKVTSGSRYAATTLSSYLIIAIGIVLVFNTIGGSWSQIQWLVAALGVGIGFGLQEIVANFISGIIILFERPIRVGDVVTVGDTDGVVTRIQIRATTIRNWDHKELLVPNKEFITGRLLNWSLSDQITRVIVTVGIAYGSDVQKAMALIAEAAEEHERVLDDPAPVVTFEEFGDNALTILLRAYLGSLDYRLATISELHQAIELKLNAAGIVIAFPQRDVHLDTIRPLDIRVRRDRGEPDSA